MREGLGTLRRLLGTTVEEAPAKIQHLQDEIRATEEGPLAGPRRGRVAELDRLLAGAETIGDARFAVGEITARIGQRLARDRRPDPQADRARGSAAGRHHREKIELPRWS